MGDRMSAIGRRACLGDGLAEGIGEAGVGAAVTGAEALAVLAAGGAAIPVTGAGACDVAATARSVVPEAGSDADLPGAVSWEVLVAVGVTDTAGLAAPAEEATELAAAGADGAALAAGDAWPADGALDRLAELALAVGVAWLAGASACATAGTVLVTGSVTELTRDPRTLVSPESSGGWLPVAASAWVAVSDRSKQIPPLAIANRAARRMTRRVLGFGIDNSRSRETTPALRMPGRGGARGSRACRSAVADGRSVRSPAYSAEGRKEYPAPISALGGLGRPLEFSVR
jgi:hypothetical protein